MKPTIKDHNEKVEQLHSLAEWFVEEYKGNVELSEIAEDLKNASLRIGKLIDEK
ncbi:hypothetical protein [Rummeliibacillus stabekisii]|uniref:hypothetical protein n=1 Tax=Rummeliibacillus stabekisii TaxID=241244 RepID=UPI003716D19E